MGGDRHYPLYWVNSDNFGDALNVWLYRTITGREPIHAQMRPKITAIGSVLHMAASRDIVWGTGCVSPNIPLRCDSTTDIRALRGPLTKEVVLQHRSVVHGERIKVPDLYGDPAILLPRFIEPSSKKRYKACFFPHYTDANLRIRLPDDVISIHPMTGSSDVTVREVVRLITSSEYVVSSSLHGIIIAEAYGVPALWVVLTGNVAGHGFKFRDYYLGTGRTPPEPQNWYKEQHWDRLDEITKRQKPEYNQGALLACCPFNETIEEMEN